MIVYNKSNYKIKLIFYIAMLSQFTSILRAIGLYNPSIIIQVIKVIVSLTFWIGFLIRFRRIKFNNVEWMLIIIPVLSAFFGLIKYGATRDFFSSVFNPLNFMIIISYIKNFYYIESKAFFEKMSNNMIIVLFISLLMYEIMPFIGYKVYTVGKTSVPFVLPLIFYISYSNKYRALITLFLLIIASKRGVILATFAALFLFFKTNKIVSKKTSRIMLISIFLFFIFILLYTSNYKNYSDIKFEGLVPLLSKIERLNPLSDRFNLMKDARVVEIISSVKGLDNFGEYLIGGGAGYTYEFEFSKTLDLDRHNTHFTPTSIMTKYGIVYMILIYYYILSTVKIAMKYRKVNNIIYLLGIYVFASMIYSFTAFTMYTEYINIVSIAMIRSFDVRVLNKLNDLQKCKS